MSDSSGRWLARQKRDPFVREARSSGYRSRAAFKLEELDRRCGLLRSGMRLLDLGAAPGSWAQYAASRVGPKGVVVACDLLEIAPLDAVHIIQGDARDDAIQDRIRAAVGAKALDLVICDMAPNLSGIRVRDQAEAMALLEVALELAQSMLRQGTPGGKAAGQQGRSPGGSLVAKLFQGSGSDEWLADVRKLFATVRIVKPRASREESREVYVVAQGLKRQSPVELDGSDELDESQLG